MRGRPIKPTADAKLARRRAQYRNAKRRKLGLPEDPVPAAPVRRYERWIGTPCPCDRAVWMGPKGWVPVVIDAQGRRIFV